MIFKVLNHFRNISDKFIPTKFFSRNIYDRNLSHGIIYTKKNSNVIVFMKNISVSQSTSGPKLNPHGLTKNYKETCTLSFPSWKPSQNKYYLQQK